MTPRQKINRLFVFYVVLVVALFGTFVAMVIDGEMKQRECPTCECPPCVTTFQYDCPCSCDAVLECYKECNQELDVINEILKHKGKTQ